MLGQRWQAQVFLLCFSFWLLHLHCHLSHCLMHGATVPSWHGARGSAAAPWHHLPHWHPHCPAVGDCWMKALLCFHSGNKEIYTAEVWEWALLDFLVQEAGVREWAFLNNFYLDWRIWLHKCLDQPNSAWNQGLGKDRTDLDPKMVLTAWCDICSCLSYTLQSTRTSVQAIKKDVVKIYHLTYKKICNA